MVNGRHSYGPRAARNIKREKAWQISNNHEDRVPVIMRNRL
jgi:hypothetical protein